MRRPGHRNDPLSGSRQACSGCPGRRRKIFETGLTVTATDVEYAASTASQVFASRERSKKVLDLEKLSGLKLNVSELQKAATLFDKMIK